MVAITKTNHQGSAYHTDHAHDTQVAAAVVTAVVVVVDVLVVVFVVLVIVAVPKTCWEYTAISVLLLCPKPVGNSNCKMTVIPNWFMNS